MRSYSIAGGKEGEGTGVRNCTKLETLGNKKKNENGKGITKKERKAMEVQVPCLQNSETENGKVGLTRVYIQDFKASVFTHPLTI